MKKIKFLSLALGALLMSACSSNEDATLNDEAGVQRIVLSVENAGSGLKARAGRELLSSEAKQSIENVKVVIVNSSNSIVKVKEITDWNTSATNYTTGGHGKMQEWVLAGDERLSAGSYTVYAFGYHTGTAYSDLGMAALTVGSTFNGNKVISTANVYAEEIFAGSIQFTLTNDKEALKTNIVLHRQVAGVFAYLKSIPYVAGAKYLRLYASDNKKQLCLGNFAPATGELANNGTGNTNNKVINCAGAYTGKTKILEADLASWFSAIAEDANHCIDATNWITAGHDNFTSGSVFMGNFIVPFQTDATNTTFVLELQDNAGTVLRSWNIKLPAAEALTTATTITAWNGTAWADNAAYTETTSAYSIFRNHLYGVGKKFTDTKNDDPTDPEKDDPVDLNTKETLILKVNDNWEVLHTMEVE